MPIHLNEDIAGRLEEVSRLLAEQGASRFRVGAYRHAADELRRLRRPVSEIFAAGGHEALKSIPGVGESIARTIRDLLHSGRLAILDRLRGELDPIALLTSVPGLGRTLAEKVHGELGIESLEELEAAAHDGRLETIAGLGRKRLGGIRDSLAHRLSRVRKPASSGEPAGEPDVAEVLDVDREYARKVNAGTLKRIAPRRFNPGGEAWLPVLHTARGRRHYTALFSNTAHAHQQHKTRDWVVLYFDDGSGEQQQTVITAGFGPLKGHRIVRGRERECAAYYKNKICGGPPQPACAHP